MVFPTHRVLIATAAILGLGMAVRPAGAESKHVFGIHFWKRGANVDVMSHETGWVVFADVLEGGGQPNNTLVEEALGESFTAIQRLDWSWGQTVPKTQAEQNTFASNCGSFADKIKRRCRHYLIGNEVEFFNTVPEYISAFVKCRNAIKAVQPEAMVHIGHFNDLGNLRQVIQAVGPNGYDGLTAHVGATVPTEMLNMLDQENARPEVGVYITEFGWVRDTNPRAATDLRAFYQALGTSNRNRSRQVFCACWFVYPEGIGWNSFSLQLAVLDNPAFEAATALHTSFNSHANNPILMSEMYADVADAGQTLSISWKTNVPARRQIWWMPLGNTMGQSKPLDSTLATSHSFSLTGLGIQQSYEIMPQSTANDYGDAGGRRFRAKTGPWPSTAVQTGPGRVLIRWTTDWPANSRVEYGPAPALTQSLTLAAATTDHNVELTGLAVGTYAYRISSKEPNPDGEESLAMRSPTRTFIVTSRTPGDFDLDGDVDLEDFGVLQRCLTGSGVAVTEPACLAARLDADEDVDQNDFGIFQRCLGGSKIPASPSCAD